MTARIACLLAFVPLALFAANHPPNYDALADLPESPAPAFTWFGGNRSIAAASVEDAARHFAALSNDSSAYVAQVHDTGRGAIVVKFRQRIDGIEVFRSELNVAMTRDRKLLAMSGSLSPSGARQLAKTAHSEGEAISIAIADLDAENAGTPLHNQVWFPFPDHLEPAWFIVVDAGDAMYSYVISANDNRILFRKNLTEEDAEPFTYRVWADPNGVHRPLNGPQGFAGIPHPTGINDGYQAPFTTPQPITLAYGPISTHDPWLASDATQTNGNNVDAYVDLSSPDGLSSGDFRAGTTSAHTFDSSYDLGSFPAVTRTQQQAAITQLFYDINFFHDWYYDSGFTEAAGNGQLDNYGRGGVPGDPLRAEAQDYSGRNNANMSAPPDGVRPRMQMYIWDAIGARDLNVDSPSIISGDYGTGTAAFGPSSFNISGDVVAIAPAEGCSAITTPLTGKIAFIDRGSCNFSVKATIAKTAGAIGVIVGNVASSASPGSFVTMACSVTPCPTAETTLPPSFHLKLADADAFRAQLANGPVHVTMQRDRGVDRDGDLDNEVIAHEWGHYLSNRLIANSSGLTSQQSRGMGEGWSDFLALLLVARPEDTAVPSNANFNGVYSAAQYVTGGGTNGPLPNGGYYFAVRRVPYSTDMTRDPLTLKHMTRGNSITGAAISFGADGSNNSEVHATGEVWATMLWECYASLLRDTLGDHPRLTFVEAQQRMKDYIVASLKMTPANPTFLEGRDALLAAALASDATDFREFWEAFAKRGAGIHAVPAQRYSTANTGTVEDFTVGANASLFAVSLDDSVNSCAADGVLDTGERGMLRVTLRNSGNARLQATTAVVTSTDSRLTFDGGLTFAAMEPGQTATATVNANLASTNEVVEPKISIAIADPALASAQIAVFQPRLNARDETEQSAVDNVESSRTAWKVTAGSPSALAWHPLVLTPRSHVWKANESLAASDSALESPLLVVAPNRPLHIGFRQRYWFDITTNSSGNLLPIDGGVVEISTDDGKTWSDIGAATSPGYGSVPIAPGLRNPLEGRKAFIGTSPGASLDDPEGSPFTNTTIDLGSAYAGQRVRIRFRIVTASSHATGALLGWQIDDISVSGITNLPFFGLVADRGICGTFDTATSMRDLPPATVEATVSSATNVPNGTVDFLENGEVVGSALVVNGKATWNAAADLAAGNHTIIASFAGSTNFKPSMSAAIAIQVTPPLRHRAITR